MNSSPLSFAKVASLIAVAVGVGLAACEKPATPASIQPLRVEIEVTADGYKPESVKAEAGRPLVPAFKRTPGGKCVEEITVPTENVKKFLPVGEVVEVAFTPKSKGTIGFACGMDMVHGSIVVE